MTKNKRKNLASSQLSKLNIQFSIPTKSIGRTLLSICPAISSGIGTTMPTSKYHSIPLVEGKSFTTEESSIEVAVFPIQNYGQFIEFCKINGSARIHISVNLEERIKLHASYPPFCGLIMIKIGTDEENEC